MGIFVVEKHVQELVRVSDYLWESFVVVQAANFKD